MMKINLLPRKLRKRSELEEAVLYWMGEYGAAVFGLILYGLMCGVIGYKLGGG